VTGPHLARFEAPDEQFARHHPAGVPHEHLAILAVRPDRQHRGIGTALMSARHAVLDHDGTPAYLEASDSARRGIYCTRGYTDHGEAIHLPHGPRMDPMCRQPGRGGQGGRGLARNPG
jgi:GNAT superfamily N-acetyltransferase